MGKTEDIMCITKRACFRGGLCPLYTVVFVKESPHSTVGCEARAIIHGHVGAQSDKRATLLVYDLTFFSRRGTRIKDADVLFEFRSRSRHPGAVGPTVAEVRPKGQSRMGETIQNQASKFNVSFNINPPVVAGSSGLTASGEHNISKDVKFHTIVTGDNPADLEWGDHYQARFTLAENESQRSGIPTQLTIVMLLERDNDDDFEMIPQIEVTPNLASGITSLGSTRSSDDPVHFSVQEPPLNCLNGNKVIDSDNLGATDLDSLWICTMYSLYVDGVKQSAPH
ncbi:hypothetical protein M406DRAFT_356233 [Cryphonectria parasitica EP155]|uniref:Uncharacterized protein n=1 Tax=Cryphonectria parasitica (strain ATCC 38755 / EP155) TaxID=660469 RepID=A0A9P4Y3D0_CRYP1|nr:uncharacterized protein M406DRAFT_356233 [Cryphonectria parasitica EP155]KAF3766194.1 hypothetical protein M406DRAFT_356233 [Cryphonectria parasitica EP155]